ncbi:MAG: PAS domain S-box protein [Betaproteobacteria bacterium]|nr:PAS domain S-box protein [Betaproteobacteria bacterium]
MARGKQAPSRRAPARRVSVRQIAAKGAAPRAAAPRRRPVAPSLSSAQTLSELVLHLREAVYVTDAEGRILDANAAALALFGASSLAELRRHTVQSLLVDPAQRREEHDALKSGGIVRDFEFRFRTLDGRDITAIDTAIARVDPHTGQTIYLGMLVDITARKRVEEALRASEEKYRNLLENMGEGLLILRDNHIVFSNPSAQRLTGYSADELLRMNFIETAVHPDDRAAIRERYRRRMAGEPTERTYAFRFRRKDGAQRWMEVSAMRITWDGGHASLSFMADITERKRIEDELTLTKERYDFATAVGKVGTWDWDPATGALVWSDETFRLMGFEPGAVVPTYELYLGLVHPEDRDPLSAAVQAALQQRKPYDLDCRIVQRTGTQLVCHVTGSVEFDPQGRPTRMLGTIQDVTERKRLEDKLRDNLIERETILDTSIVGIAFLDSQGRARWLNRAMRDILRIGSDESIAGRSLEPYYLSRDAYLAVGGAVSEAVRAGRAYQSELQMRRGDGSVFWVLLSGRAVNADDLSQGTVWAVLDISRRKDLEEQLRRTSSEREAALRNTLVGITCTANRIHQWVNPRFCEMVGYTENELIGRSTEMCFPDSEYWSRFGAQAYAALARGESFSSEYQLKRKDGTLFWAETYGNSIERGDPARGTIWTVLDITERRRAMVDIQEALEKQKELNLLKSRFVSMTSHEFRTPLSAILSSAQLIKRYGERLPAAEKEGLLDNIEAAVRRMTQMLDDILIIGRAESGAIGFKPVKTDIEALCSFLIEEVRGTLPPGNSSKHPTIRFEAKGADHLAVVDEKLLRHILGNLLSNAVKYSPDGGCVTLVADCGNGETRFVVSDQGLGIPEEDIPRLFGTFFRASNAGNIPGTGLGLAIVKRAVDLHQGSIRVASKAGQGTRFEVVLPGIQPGQPEH